MSATLAALAGCAGTAAAATRWWRWAHRPAGREPLTAGTWRDYPEALTTDDRAWIVRELASVSIPAPVWHPADLKAWDRAEVAWLRDEEVPRLEQAAAVRRVATEALARWDELRACAACEQEISEHRAREFYEVRSHLEDEVLASYSIPSPMLLGPTDGERLRRQFTAAPGRIVVLDDGVTYTEAPPLPRKERRR